MQNILYLDCFSGVAGDMTLSSLVDAGADRDVLNERIRALTDASVTLRFERVLRNGAAGLHLRIDPPDKPLKHEYPALRNEITEAELPDPIREPAVKALDRLANVEARFHGCEPEEVHFDEIAGFDLLVDLVGTATCLDNLDVDALYYPDVPVSSGWLDSHHGRLPLPAPAVMELLKDVRVYDSGREEEVTTPTGATILTTMGQQRRGIPDLSVSAIGYGAGTRDFDDRPNLLRAVLGTGHAPGRTEEGEDTLERICQIETNLDDTTPEIISHVMDELLDAGALDVFVLPATMKKNRSGHVLTVLCDPDDRSRLTDLLFAESSTFGVRTSIKNRTVLPRSTEEVETPWGTVQMKVGHVKGREKATPEFDDCRRLAREHDCSLSDVIKAAQKAWESS